MKNFVITIACLLFSASQAFATESKLIVQCFGSHSANTVLNIYEISGSEGLAQVNIIVSRSNGNDDGDNTTQDSYSIRTISKDGRPLKKEAFGWALRKSAEAIQDDKFYGFLFATAEPNSSKGAETLYLNLQRYEGSAPNLMVISGQVEELSCHPTKG